MPIHNFNFVSTAKRKYTYADPIMTLLTSHKTNNLTMATHIGLKHVNLLLPLVRTKFKHLVTD
jgi:hypothetical protein